MELGGGATRFRHQRSPPSTDRLLEIFHNPSSLSSSSSSSLTPPLELSEHDIFSTPSGSSSPSPTHPFSRTPLPNRTHNGILAALNDNKTRSSSDSRPVFNHSASASLSSSSSTSPAASITIPRRPPPPPVLDRVRFRPQSAPVNVPMMIKRRVVGDLDDVVLEEEGEEEEKEKGGGVILPPHEMVAARHSPMLACSVLEGAGRTLKGRDLRQVRNAVWRRTGFID